MLLPEPAVLGLPVELYYTFYRLSSAFYNFVKKSSKRISRAVKLHRTGRKYISISYAVLELILRVLLLELGIAARELV